MENISTYSNTTPRVSSRVRHGRGRIGPHHPKGFKSRPGRRPFVPLFVELLGHPFEGPLALLKLFLLRWEPSVEGLRIRRGHVVDVAEDDGPGHAVQGAVKEGEGHEAPVIPAVGHGDAPPFRAHEAVGLVVVRVAQNEDRPVTETSRLIDGSGDEDPSKALPVKLRRDAHRPEGDGVVLPSVGGAHLRRRVEDAARHGAVPLDHEGELGDKIPVPSYSVDEQMLHASGDVEIPEGVPGDLLHPPLVPGPLAADSNNLRPVRDHSVFSSKMAATLFSSSMTAMCWGQTVSHWPQAMHLLAFPPLRVAKP